MCCKTNIIFLVLTLQKIHAEALNDVIAATMSMGYEDSRMLLQSNPAPSTSLSPVLKLLSADSAADQVSYIQDLTGTQWPKGIVPFVIDQNSYDIIAANKIRNVIETVQISSCVYFQENPDEPSEGVWLHFTNPGLERECVHEVGMSDTGEVKVVIGIDCLNSDEILHTVLHGLGFKDEVSHPHRDQYVRILWENIQPKYRHLFQIQNPKTPQKILEYDPMSIMHFHDRAFSANSGPTIAPAMPGLQIKPLTTLSPIDIMKLSLLFGYECNKRKVSTLLDTCRASLHPTNNDSNNSSEENNNYNNGFDNNNKEKDGSAGKQSHSRETYESIENKKKVDKPEKVNGKSKNDKTAVIVKAWTTN